MSEFHVHYVASVFHHSRKIYILFSLHLHTNLITRSLLNNVRKIYRSKYRPVSNTGKHTSNKKNMEIWTIVHFPNPFPSPDFHHQTFTTYQFWKIMTISRYFYTAACPFPFINPSTASISIYTVPYQSQ